MLSITLDFDALVPVYRQIADEIRALIARGQLTDGAELPSVRRLGEAVGVNQNTVAKAYRILADEGFVSLRRGAAAKVRLPRGSYREAGVQDDEERRLDDLISRWVLAGASRRDIEERVARALDSFFEAERSEA